jgi:preprotein translocase subunit YajC
MSGFLIIVIVFGAIWLLFLMPARRRRFQHSAMQDSVEVGDEIITAGGIHGRVTAVEDDVVQVEIASGVTVKLDRRAVAAVATEVDLEPEPEEAAGPS